MSKFRDLLEKLKSRDTRLPQEVDFAAGQVEPKPDPATAKPGKHYFAIVINELFLESSRRWFQEFDPTVIAITEFIYGNETVSLPFVVGPSLLAAGGGVKAPQGMLYRDTRVAGIHPFRGGRISSTVLLCRSVRKDYAKELLSLVESVSAALPFGSNVEPFVKVGRAVLGGVEAMFELDQTQAVAGLRREFDHDLGQPIQPAFFALVDTQGERLESDRLKVVNTALHIRADDGTITPYRDRSYVLFSLHVIAETSEIDALPFAKKANSLIQLAASNNDADWERVKSELLVLLGELLSSRDLTEEQAYTYHGQVVERAKRARQAAKDIGRLSAVGGDSGAKIDALDEKMRTAAMELLKLD